MAVLALTTSLADMRERLGAMVARRPICARHAICARRLAAALRVRAFGVAARARRLPGLCPAPRPPTPGRLRGLGAQGLWGLGA